jgi:hypothetical protein
MPARGDVKPPAPPAKDVWLAAFEAELVGLRPHLATIGGKVKRSIALAQWVTHSGDPPAEAARAWHKANPLHRP